MNNLNSILLEGGLVAEPFFEKTAKGTSKITFDVDSVRIYKDDGKFEEEHSVVHAEAWAKLADSIHSIAPKAGRQVRIVGRLAVKDWTDLNGQAHNSVMIVAEHVEFRPETSKAPAIPEPDDEDIYDD